VEELFAAVARVPASLVTIAVTLHPPGSDGRLRLGCLVRVAAEVKGLPKAAADVVAAAGQVGARLRRLDGQHATATYATLPTAAGLR
jgi:hypothetical protein